MIFIAFLKNEKGDISGFEITGHADDAQSGKSIVCAAVSSAAYMTANTIIEILNINANVKINDSGKMFLLVKNEEADLCRTLFLGFKLHLENLMEQYENDICITYMEV